MTNFPKPVLDYWHEAFAGDSSSTWAVSETLNPKRPAMMLEQIDGSVRTVLRLPDGRGKGYARAVVLTISDFLRREGYEPQYRCQLDNLASVALANSCGFALFGKWIVVSDVSDRPMA